MGSRDPAGIVLYKLYIIKRYDPRRDPFGGHIVGHAEIEGQNFFKKMDLNLFFTM